MRNRVLRFSLVVVTCLSFGSILSVAVVHAQAKAPAPARVGLQLQLPSCVKTGNCKLDDIVTTGANFANFLTTLSGAVFFATFVYGGSMYLLSFGRKEYVSKGMNAMKSAAIGLVIVLSAWTLVNYLAFALTGQAT